MKIQVNYAEQSDGEAVNTTVDIQLKFSKSIQNSIFQNFMRESIGCYKAKCCTSRNQVVE